MDLVELACVSLLLIRARRRRQQIRRRRRYWVQPIVGERIRKVDSVVSDLREDPSKFFEFFRMSTNSFDKLLSIVGHKITKQATVMRRPISPEKRLAVTLRYLAAGNTLSSLQSEFNVGKSTIGGIVRETCGAIWISLLPLYMKPKTTEEWEQVSELFYTNTQFPNCVGAMIAKHVPIVYSNNSGPQCSSLVLLGLVDGDFLFTDVDVRGYREDSNSNAIRSSNLGQKVEKNLLNFPSPQHLPNDENGTAIPFMVVGDEAFRQTQHVICPYPKPKKHSEGNLSKKVFNSRLTCARRVAECTFATMANKWPVLRKDMDVDVDLAKHIVQTCCILHNYIQKEEGFCPVDIACCSYPWVSLPLYKVRGTRKGYENRDYLANYFMSPKGSVQWQYDET